MVVFAPLVIALLIVAFGVLTTMITALAVCAIAGGYGAANTIATANAERPIQSESGSIPSPPLS